MANLQVRTVNLRLPKPTITADYFTYDVVSVSLKYSPGAT